MRIAFHSPSLDIFGGGEKYFLSALAEAADLADDDVTLLSPTPPRVADWTKMLGVTIPEDRLQWKLAEAADVSRLSGNFDVLVTNMGLQPASRAARSIALIQVPPNPVVGMRLTDASRAHVRRIRHRLRLRRYELICNSRFTERYVRLLTGRDDTLVIYPPIDPPSPLATRKGPIILSVARFFPMKQQTLLIDAFRNWYTRTPEASAWELHLVGIAGASDYMSLLNQRAADLPVYIHPSAPRDEVLNLYRRASIFWHAAGFGSPAHDPAQMEHFGMTTVEAMGYGCVPIVINAGGQPEIVTDGVDGYLWNTVEELTDATSVIIGDRVKYAAMAAKARRTACRFQASQFRHEIRQLLTMTNSPRGKTG